MVEIASVDARRHRVRGSATLDNAKSASALFDAPLAQLAASADATARGTMEISLGDVTNGNSVLVSLMLVWMRRARKAGLDVAFIDIPPLVRNLIEFCGLDEVLPMPVAGTGA